MGDAPTLPPVTTRAAAAAGTPAPMPSAADIARLTAKGFRRSARRQRRRRRLAGSLLTVVALGAIAAGGYAGYLAFVQQDGTDVPPGGLQGALGEAIGSVEGLGGFDPTVAAGLAGTLALSDVRPADVLPTFALGVARDLGSADGMRRYAVNADDLGNLEPALTSTWLATLAKLPRADVGDDVLPPPGRGELVIGITQDGDRVLRLAVRSAEPPLSIDTTG